MRCFLILIVLATACETQPRPDNRHDRVTAAAMLTARYAREPFTQWKIRADAAGTQCDVLVINTNIILEESMVDALHTGAGAYGVVSGGLRRFSNERAFRAVAYRDATGRVWAYGGVSAEDAVRMRRCE